MWVTVKDIVKEIKASQDILAARIEDIAKETNDFQKQILCKVDAIAQQLNGIQGNVNSLENNVERNGNIATTIVSVDQSCADYLKLLNKSQKDILKNLAMLDEENRLLIAKTLLKDLDV